MSDKKSTYVYLYISVSVCSPSLDTFVVSQVGSSKKRHFSFIRFVTYVIYFAGISVL